MSKLHNQKKIFPGRRRRVSGKRCYLHKQKLVVHRQPPAVVGFSLMIPGPDQPSGGASKIVKVEIHPAKKVFGENARNPDRPCVVAWAENGARFAAMIPLGAKYVDGDLKILDPERYHRSISYAENGKLKSRFGAFVAKYGSWPRVGLTVSTRTDERGYLTIDTDSEATG